MPRTTASFLISPCGMNCGICRAHLRRINPCPGCRSSDAGKPITRVRCKIKTCANFKDEKRKYCFQCDDFPCANLEHLDKRYRLKYRMSMIENLVQIKKSGIRKFLVSEKLRWECLECGGTVCVHNGKCAERGRGAGDKR